MMRIAAILCFVCALTGTPLRQAEAASDFSRSLAELFQANCLDSPDGGVGDDSGVTIHGNLHAAFTVDVSPSDDPLLPPLFAPPLAPEVANRLRERVWWPSRPPNLRHAWLQVFLF
jgi:hypothetical protein